MHRKASEHTISAFTAAVEGKQATHGRGYEEVEEVEPMQRSQCECHRAD